MKLSLKIAVGLVLALAAVAASLAIAARFADGPLAIIAGGPFTTGEVHEGLPPDWAFVKDIETIEMQSLNPARSRTTWVLPLRWARLHSVRLHELLLGTHLEAVAH